MSDERGFTVVEVAVAGLLTVLLGLSMLRFFDSAVSASVEQQESTQHHAEARGAIDQLVRELRQAYTGDPALTPVVSIAAREITFHSPDNSTPLRLRRIAYRIQAGELQRSASLSAETGSPPWTFPDVGPWVGVMQVREADAFSGYDDAGAATTDPAAIRRIDVSLTGRNSEQRADRPFQVSINLRNA